MAKTASNHSKAHMDDMNKKAAAAHKKQTIERIKAFLKQSEEYFDVQDRLEQAYSEAGLANAMRWTVQRLQGYYDYNDGREAEVVEAQVEAFEAGNEGIDDPRCVMSYYVRLAYQRIQEQIDTSPIYQEKGMVTRGIFLNKQKRLQVRRRRGERPDFGFIPDLRRGQHRRCRMRSADSAAAAGNQSPLPRRTGKAGGGRAYGPAEKRGTGH